MELLQVQHATSLAPSRHRAAQPKASLRQKPSLPRGEKTALHHLNPEWNSPAKETKILNYLVFSCLWGGWVGIQPSQKEDRFWKGGPKSFLKVWRDGDVVKSGESQIQLPTCIFPCKACQLLFPVLPRCLNANCDSDIQRQRSDLEKGPFMGTWRHQVSRGSKVWWASSS